MLHQPAGASQTGIQGRGLDPALRQPRFSMWFLELPSFHSWSFLDHLSNPCTNIENADVGQGERHRGVCALRSHTRGTWNVHLYKQKTFSPWIFFLQEFRIKWERLFKCDSFIKHSLRAYSWVWYFVYADKNMKYYRTYCLLSFFLLHFLLLFFSSPFCPSPFPPPLTPPSFFSNWFWIDMVSIICRSVL